MYTYVNDDSFVQKTLFFCSHYKIVSAIFIVNNILQINSWKENISEYEKTPVNS